MNKWLGEPVLGFQLPGRGILKNFINKVIIWNTLIVRMAKQKTTGDFTCRFIFLIGKTKNLQVKKFVKMTLVIVQFFSCRFLTGKIPYSLFKVQFYFPTQSLDFLKNLAYKLTVFRWRFYNVIDFFTTRITSYYYPGTIKDLFLFP